jgi:hypothetical protein
MQFNSTALLILTHHSITTITASLGFPCEPNRKLRQPKPSRSKARQSILSGEPSP